MPIQHDEEVAIAFGRNLRAAREKAGIGQEKLAHDTGLHRTAIGFLENGKRVPRLDTLLLLAQTLKIEPADLLKDVKASPTPKTEWGA